jgi:hypothetical protein
MNGDESMPRIQTIRVQRNLEEEKIGVDFAINSKITN